MEHELSFPSPLERHDLPRKRRKWPRLLAVTVVVLGLAAGFLPQFMLTRAGRNLAAGYLGMKTGRQVWIGEIETSWLGPTRVRQLVFTDGEGRQMKLESASSPVSLGSLLLGRYHLGEASIDRLHVEYVVDTGAAKRARPGEVVDRTLPDLSGRIKLTDATLVLTRGQVQATAPYQTVYRSVRLAGITGQLDIPALDQACRIELAGRVPAEENDGTFTVAGTIDLGADGKLDAGKVEGSLALQMRDVPNATGGNAAPIGWIVAPGLPAEEFAELLGPRLASLEAVCTAGGGFLRFEKLEATGTTMGGLVPRVSGQMAIDLEAGGVLIKPGQGRMTMTAPPTRTLTGRDLALVQPFLADAVAGEGQVQLDIEWLWMPLRALAADMGGTLAVRDVALHGQRESGNQAFPQGLALGWRAITGEADDSPKLQIPGTRFTVQNRMARCEPSAFSINGTQGTVGGTMALGGKARMTATIELPEGLRGRVAGLPKTLEVPLSGMSDSPTMDLAGAVRPLPTETARQFAGVIAEHLTAQRRAETETMMRDKQKQVEDIMGRLGQLLGEGEATTRP